VGDLAYLCNLIEINFNQVRMSNASCMFQATFGIYV